MVTIHFLIHEQELISVLPIISGLKTLTENWLLWCLLGFPSVDPMLNIEITLELGNPGLQRKDQTQCLSWTRISYPIRPGLNDDNKLIFQS